MLSILFELLCGHAVADFALQSETMAKGKNRHKQPDFIPEVHWFYFLTAHALVHGYLVGWAMGSVECAMLMTVLHWTIDFMKCEKWFSQHYDQLLHLMCLFGFALHWCGYL